MSPVVGPSVAKRPLARECDPSEDAFYNRGGTFPLKYFLDDGDSHKLILISDRFFHSCQSLVIIGDMYQHTEAFCHYS